jgi:hypothetical protein
MFRYEKIIEDFGGIHEESSSEGLDVVKKFAYESSLK